MQNLQNQEPLKQLFATEKITDVLVTGFIERGDSPLTFHPMLWWVYVRFKSCYLRCESINAWFLKLDIAKDIARHFDIEDDEFCVASIREAFVFNAHLEHKITAFHCLLDEDCDLKNGKIKAGGFCLEHGDTLFFDPSSYEGIRLGSVLAIGNFSGPGFSASAHRLGRRRRALCL